MSAQFSDTTNYKGLVQIYEKEINAQRGFVSGNSDRLKEFTADVNLALDDFTALAIRSSGKWQYDDSNHTDFPIITTNLVSGQRDYTFTTDEGGNIILEIYRVFIKTPGGTFIEIDSVDQQSESDTSGFWDGLSAGGTPIKYDKTANGIFLDPVPNYNSTNGLKVYINREASYFTSSDTTKKAGIPGIFHKYLAIRPAEDYARRNSLDNYQAIRAERVLMEQEIQEYFALRNRDDVKRMKVNFQDNR